MKRWEDLFRTKKREYALVILFFLLVTILFTWPLILHMHNGTVGGHADPLLNTWIITWDAHTIFTHPTNLFQGNILYPARDVLAYSEHLFTLGVLAAPIYHATNNPVLAYNILLLLGMVFSGFGCYLLIKELTGSRWGGLAGGLFFALCHYKISQMEHIQIAFSAFLPFMLLYIYRYLDKGERKNLLLFGLFFLAQSLVSWHYFLFCSLAAGLLLVWTAVWSRNKEEWLRLAAVLAAMIIAIALIIPFALPYLRARERLPDFERSLTDTEFFAANPGDYLTISSDSLLYGSSFSPLTIDDLNSERVLFPGLVIILLALAGLFMRRRKDDRTKVFDRKSYRTGALYFLVLTVVSVILTFGPKIAGVTNPLYTIPYHLGLFKFIRFPSRFFVLAALGLSVLAGYGTGKLYIRISQRRSQAGFTRMVFAMVLFLLLAELATFNLVVHPVPVWGEVPEVYSWLEEQEVRAIELPMGTDDFPRKGMIMYLSTYHWREIANGYSGYDPPSYLRITSEMQGFPSQRSVDLLRGLEIDYVIWHWNWVAEEDGEEYEERLRSTPGLALERSFGDIEAYRVEEGPVAGIEDLQVGAVAPEAVPEGEGFNMALMVANTSEAPLVVVEEEPQPLRIEFVDEDGNSRYEYSGSYRAPFFLDGGEETFLPVAVEETPAVGSYTLETYLEGGVLGEREFSLAVEVREPEELVGDGVLEGGVALEAAGDPIEIPSPDGLYPIVLEVENTGELFWRSSWEEEQAEGDYPFGLVLLGLRWGQDGEAVWREQDAVLSCDLSPGQSVRVPLLIRPPAEPGSYQLFAALRDADVGWFGEALIVEVVVE